MLDTARSSNLDPAFLQKIAAQIWEQKYQYKVDGIAIDKSWADTVDRVVKGLMPAENLENTDHFHNDLYAEINGFRLLPAGRILFGCGSKHNVTLSNTFVMRTLPDSVPGLLEVIKEAGITMQMGGGLGFDFSTLRPKGSVVRGLDCPAAGPVAAMDICDSVCKMLVTGMGRGAMMATMRCDHPDIAEFVTAKSDRTRLRNFNLSVLVTDNFMKAVKDDSTWDLVWGGVQHRRMRARDLWDLIMQHTFQAAEPGVLFIDQINQRNPLNYLERIAATNSCAEQPLPPNGTCPLTSVNMARLVVAPFTDQARLDVSALRRLTGLAVRMLDNTLDVSLFPLEAQRREAQEKRRIGVGVTGVADALAMLGVRYGSQKAAFLLGSWMQTLQNEAYRTSAQLACERGTFPRYDAVKHLNQPAIAPLDPDVRALIASHGLRNGTLTTIAPTGTISMLAGNVSSGIEPIFATHYNRAITQPDGKKGTEKVSDYAVWLFEQRYGDATPLPDSFVTVQDLTPQDHLRMQSAAQRWVDSGISKTVNCAEDISFDDFQDIYHAAYEAGCKGCTTYRPNAITGSVLST